MADVFEPEVRSYVMSKIRKTDTKPEMAVRKHLFKSGFRYRIHYRKLPGNPDIVMPKYNLAIFVNGCFWHAHEGCKYNKMPKSNRDYWVPKIKRNVERDKKNNKELYQFGWHILTVWECEIETEKRENTFNRLTNKINQIINKPK